MRTEIALDQAPAACCSPLGLSGMSAEEAATTAAVFKALADPGRVRIVNLLANAGGPVCVCDLIPELGLSQPTVSFHLMKLVRAGLLLREQRGVWAFYSVNRDVLERLRAVVDLEAIPRATEANARVRPVATRKEGANA